MTHTFTSLRHPVEKLLEAEHFLGRLVQSDGIAFQFELNAFLSASRSVTFMMQSALARVPGFEDWYALRVTEMRSDAALRFFLELRNISQKAGPVSYVGGSRRDGGWTYRFVGRPNAVPAELVGKDIGAACALHLGKLARLVLDCSNAFVFASCPHKAFSAEGIAELGYGRDDVEAALGLPSSYLHVAGASLLDAVTYLKRDIEPLDRPTLERIAAGKLQGPLGPLEFRESSGADLVDDVAARLGETDADPRSSFLSAILQRIDRFDK